MRCNTWGSIRVGSNASLLFDHRETTASATLNVEAVYA